MNMKKLVTSVLLIVLLIAGLFTLTGCGEEKTKTPEGIKETILIDNRYDNDGTKVSLDIYYPENAGIEVEAPFESWKVFSDKEENYKVKVRLNEDSTYTANKGNHKERYADTYKEFKVGEYDAYSYEEFDNVIVFVLFEEKNEHSIRFADIEISVVSYAGNDDTGKNFYENNEEVKSIINSLTYNGTVPDPSEVTE